MMHYFTRLNRGLILAAVLLIGLSIYFVVDARAFEAETYDIRGVIVDFVQAVEALNGDFAPADNDAFTAQFITEWRHAGWHSSQWSLHQSVHHALTNFETRPPEHLITDMTFTLVEIANIQKQAANAVRVQFTMHAAAPAGNVTPAEDPRVFFFTGFGNSAYWRGTDYIHVDAMMLRTGGDWRFATASVWTGSGRGRVWM